MGIIYYFPQGDKSCSTALLFALQMIFTRYDVDKSGTMKSFEMRSAVQDAGQTFWNQQTQIRVVLTL